MGQNLSKSVKSSQNLGQNQSKETRISQNRSESVRLSQNLGQDPSEADTISIIITWRQLESWLKLVRIGQNQLKSWSESVEVLVRIS